MTKVIELLPGQKFGRLRVIENTYKKNADNRIIYKCRCRCINKTIVYVPINYLRSGDTRSCGCLRRETTAKRAKIQIVVIAPRDKFGRLTAIKRDTKQSGNVWKFKCSCPNRTICYYKAYRVKSGDVKSCGCLKRDVTIARNKLYKKHGATINGVPTHLYLIWRGIKDRCLNTNSRDYPNWGGRGIYIYRRWQYSFKAFASYMRTLPNCPRYIDEPIGKHKLRKTLDRINNNGDYVPGNIRWGSRKTQARNRRVTLWVEWQGKSIQLSKLCEKFDQHYYTIYNRIKNGWSLKRALKHPTTVGYGEQALPRIRVKIEYRGKVRLLTSVCRKFNLDRRTVSKRLNRGWLIERALNTPTIHGYSTI